MRNVDNFDEFRKLLDFSHPNSFTSSKLFKEVKMITLSLLLITGIEELRAII